jgi:hypothetical protein
LQLLVRLEGRAASYLAEAAAASDADLRVAALRAARAAGVEVIPLVEKLAVDPAPEVRRECAIALRKNPSPKVPALWAELASRHDGKDRWYLEALGIGAQGREVECFDAWRAKAGDGWNTPAGRDIVWRSRAPKSSFNSVGKGPSPTRVA